MGALRSSGNGATAGHIGRGETRDTEYRDEMGLGAEENLLCDALLCRLVLADMRTLDSRSFADEAGCTTRQALVRLDKLEAAGFLSSWRDGRGRRRFMYLDLPAR